MEFFGENLVDKASFWARLLQFEKIFVLISAELVSQNCILGNSRRFKVQTEMVIDLQSQQI